MTSSARVLAFVLVTLAFVSVVVESCPYHDRLRELAKLQNQQLRDAQSFEERQRILDYFTVQREQLRRWWQGRISQESLDNDLSEEFEQGGSSSTTNHGSMHHDEEEEEEEHITGTEEVYEEEEQVQEEEEEQQQTQNQYIPAAPQEDTVACPNTRYYVCPAGTTCVFEYGRYRCRYPTKLTCHDGYKRVNISSTQFQCIDINECEDDDLNTCEFICRNTNGGYRCDCHPGYEMNSEEGTCDDINECELGYVRCQHECLNTDGSWTCVCPEGYVYDDFRCQDINECIEPDTNDCSDDQKCLNTFGGYQCLDPPACDEGYARAVESQFGPCIVQNYSAATLNSDPVSITAHKFALFNNYPAHTNVANLSFKQYVNHRYYFTVLSGNKYFSAYRPPGRNILMLRTVRKIDGPQEITMKILATDINYNTMSYNYNRRTRTRIDITFVVSEFDF